MGKRFSWDVVDPKVTSQLLAMVDENRTARWFARLPDDKLAATATANLGAPPRADLTDELVAVAVDTWLPLAPRKRVEALAEIIKSGLSPQTRSQHLATKWERIAFIRERNRTSNFKKNVRAHFIAAHKVEVEGARKSVVPRSELQPIPLVGEGLPPIRKLHRHQTDAHRGLDRLLKLPVDPPAGVVVLPTGSGKTETMVTWLLERLQDQPGSRVLWIAGQQELLAQAASRFESWARCQPLGFRRLARVMHSGAYPISQLSSADTDIALVTIQSLMNDLATRKRAHVDNFLQRPVYVVIDEAHHAGAASYGALIERLAGKQVRVLVGLTATPFPTALASRLRFRQHFPVDVHTVTAHELMVERVLARPILHTVDTNFAVELTDQQLKLADAGDLPGDVLAELDDERRNHRVVNVYLDHEDRWGKTLLFATNIDNANHLHELLLEQGVDSFVLHSAIEGDRSEVLASFSAHPGPCVLVSVGMLTEGVDLPDARTAFLTRPTTSRVLLQQMIGRVLRGPRAGGEAEANLVYFKDLWKNFSDVLEPPEVITVPPPVAKGSGAGDHPHQGVLVVETLEGVEAPVLYDIRRQFERSPGVPVSSASLAGYYQLPDRQVPVFSHQRAPMEELFKEAVNGSLQGRPRLSFFEDVPAPHPSDRALRDLVEFVREFGETPPFVPLEQMVGPTVAADQILAAGPHDEPSRVSLIRGVYDTTIAKLAYPTFAHFEQAVEEELRSRRDRRFVGEQPIREPRKRPDKPLPHYDRDLGPAIELAVQRCRQLLPADVLERLGDLPDIDWARRPTSTNYGFWTIKLTGRTRGEQRIRINPMLRTTPKALPLETLGYLVFHELLHHLLPGQGHDAEFRELEARWPEATLHDAYFDSLHDHWDLRPERYRRRG